MKLLLCNEYCLILVLTYVLMHKRVLALVIASSYIESHVMVLVALPVSPGCCSPVLVPLKQCIDVRQLPGLRRQAAFGVQGSCNLPGATAGSGSSVGQVAYATFQGPELKGYHCYLHPSPTASYDLACGAFHSESRHRQQG